MLVELRTYDSFKEFWGAIQRFKQEHPEGIIIKYYPFHRWLLVAYRHKKKK